MTEFESIIIDKINIVIEQNDILNKRIMIVSDTMLEIISHIAHTYKFIAAVLLNQGKKDGSDGREPEIHRNNEDEKGEVHTDTQ